MGGEQDADRESSKGHEAHQKNEEGHEGHEDHGSHHEHMVRDFRTRFFISLGLTLPIAVLSPMLRSMIGVGKDFSFAGMGYVLFALATAVFFYGGWPFLKGLFKELSEKKPGMMTLIALVITVAYVYSALVVFGLEGKYLFWVLASLIDIMLLGHWIEMRSVMSASSAMEELGKLLPGEAHRLKEDGSTEEVKVPDLEKGDKVVVKPGEKVPADGEIVDGSSEVNESLLTGESKPVAKSEGDEVIGGAVNGDGSLTVKITGVGEDSFLSRVQTMVKKAQQSKSKAQGLADRAALWLTIIAITCGGLTLAGWLLFSAHDFVFSLERSVTVMIITCPHALGLAIPLVAAVSTSLAAKRGVLIRNRTAFEAARKVEAILFDKTGTLTKGEFQVADSIPFNDSMDSKELLALAGTAVLDLSAITRRKVIQNLFWATGYNVVAIPLAAGALVWMGILLSPAVGAILMSLSTVIVAINAKIMKGPEYAPKKS